MSLELGTLKKQVAELVDKFPLISDKEIGETLHVTPRFLKKLLDEMMLEEILTEKTR